MRCGECGERIKMRLTLRKDKKSPAEKSRASYLLSTRERSRWPAWMVLGCLEEAIACKPTNRNLQAIRALAEYIVLIQPTASLCD